MEINFIIIVPVYNAQRYLLECVNSVINQTYTKYKLILVDDGSNDASGEICDEISLENVNIISLHQSNMGQISARYTGISYSFNLNRDENTYYLFLDSDDKLKKNALEVLCDKIKKNNDCDCIIFGLERYYNNKNVRTFTSQFQKIVIEKRELYSIVFNDDSYNSMCRKAIRADLICNPSYPEYYNVRLGEDLLQSIEIYKNAKSVLFITECLYVYNVNLNSVTETVSFENYNYDSTVRNTVLDFLLKENVWNKQDYNVYIKNAERLLVNEIKRICYLNTSYRNIKMEFSSILNDDYFKKIVRIGNNLLLKLFSKKWFAVVYFKFKVRKKLSLFIKKVRNNK